MFLKRKNNLRKNLFFPYSFHQQTAQQRARTCSLMKSGYLAQLCLERITLYMLWFQTSLTANTVALRHDSAALLAICRRVILESQQPQAKNQQLFAHLPKPPYLCQRKQAITPVTAKTRSLTIKNDKIMTQTKRPGIFIQNAFLFVSFQACIAHELPYIIMKSIEEQLIPVITYSLLTFMFLKQHILSWNR